MKYKRLCDEIWHLTFSNSSYAKKFCSAHNLPFNLVRVDNKWNDILTRDIYSLKGLPGLVECLEDYYDKEIVILGIYVVNEAGPYESFVSFFKKYYSGRNVEKFLSELVKIVGFVEMDQETKLVVVNKLEYRKLYRRYGVKADYPGLEYKANARKYAWFPELILQY